VPVSFLAWLEKYPVADTAVRDFLGNAVPKASLTRSQTEFNDVAISNGGNLLAFVVGGLTVDKLLQALFSGVQKVGQEATTGYRWARIARSMGIYSTMVSSMWAMPFVRNYITTRRSGSVNYSQVIQTGGSNSPKTPEQEAAVKASLNDSKRHALTILGSGGVGIALSAVLGKWAASRKDFGKNFLDKLYQKPFTEKLLLGASGKFSKMGPWPTMLFWGIPAYIGWYHASRDPYEKKEVYVRLANFMACFSLPPYLAKKAFENKIINQFPELKKNISFNAIKDLYKHNPAKRWAAQKMLLTQNGLGMVSSIVLLGVTPQLLNIYLTQQRLKQVKKEETALKLDLHVVSQPMNQPQSPQPSHNRPEAPSLYLSQPWPPSQNRYTNVPPSYGFGVTTTFR
jgi:hypothetical protein